MKTLLRTLSMGVARSRSWAPKQVDRKLLPRSRSAWQKFSGNKINCFPWDQSLRVCYTAGNFKAGNSFNLAVTTLQQYSWVTVHCCPLTS